MREDFKIVWHHIFLLNEEESRGITVLRLTKYLSMIRHALGMNSNRQCYPANDVVNDEYRSHSPRPSLVELESKLRKTGGEGACT